MTMRNFKIKVFFEILWLKTNIPKSEPNVPPRKVAINKVDSEILFPKFLAWNLSAPKMKKLKAEINTKYKM